MEDLSTVDFLVEILPPAQREKLREPGVRDALQSITLGDITMYNLEQFVHLSKDGRVQQILRALARFLEPFLGLSEKPSHLKFAGVPDARFPKSAEELLERAIKPPTLNLAFRVVTTLVDVGVPRFTLSDVVRAVSVMPWLVMGVDQSTVINLIDISSCRLYNVDADYVNVLIRDLSLHMKLDLLVVNLSDNRFSMSGDNSGQMINLLNELLISETVRWVDVTHSPICTDESIMHFSSHSGFKKLIYKTEEQVSAGQFFEADDAHREFYAQDPKFRSGNASYRPPRRTSALDLAILHQFKDQFMQHSGEARRNVCSMIARKLWDENKSVWITNDVYRWMHNNN